MNQEKEPNTLPGSRNKQITVSILLVVVLSALLLALSFRGSDNVSKPNELGEQAQAVVEITDDGFIPQTLNVAPNTRIIWVNEDEAPHGVAANPFPDRSSLPDLYSGDVALGPQEEYAFTFVEPGTYVYHDPNNPELSATVVVSDDFTTEEPFVN